MHILKTKVKIKDMEDHNASAPETYRFTSEGITELILDTYAATFIFTMKKYFPFMSRKKIKQKLIESPFDPWMKEMFIMSEDKAEEYMVRYYDIGHDIRVDFIDDK